MGEASTAEQMRRIEQLLQRLEVHAALGVLNARTNLRFTGVFRHDPPLLRNLVLFDRENPLLELGGDIARLDETFCAIVRERNSAFRLEPAMADERHQRVSRRSGIVAYAGVPLRRSDGEPFGTLCHFDLRPRLVPAAELPLLERIAPLVIVAIEARDRRQSPRRAHADGGRIATRDVSVRQREAPRDSGGR